MQCITHILNQTLYQLWHCSRGQNILHDAAHVHFARQANAEASESDIHFTSERFSRRFFFC